MADQTSIEWTNSTWNPVTGCSEVSDGCDNCYAKTFAERWRGTPGHPFEQGFDLVLRPERLEQPLRWRKPRRVFVNSMSDLFHPGIPDEFIAKVFAVMAATPQHTYQLLTKRHGRMRTLLNNPEWRSSVFLRESVLDLRGPARDLPSWPLPNLWLGVSVENQRWADIRIPALLDTPAAVRWISAEPLLGPVNLAPDDHSGHQRDWMGSDYECLDCSTEEEPVVWRRQEIPPLDWVVVGGESGPGARPMHPSWVRTLRDQCVNAGVPLFFKQWGAWMPVDDSGPEGWRARRATDRLVRPDGYSWPLSEPHGAGDHDPETSTMRRVGKGAAGRLLDGQEWSQYPDTVSAGGVRR